MNVSDRIQNLRKLKGISQEELADRIGVSRQAVSKWESEQSLPDIDKVIIMSEFFDVTTDYILRGIETEKQTPISQRTPDAGIFVVVATVAIFVGLIVACAAWYEYQVALAIVGGLIIMAVGCMMFGIGFFFSTENTKAPAKRTFFTINIWFLVFIPLSLLYNALAGRPIAPYPMPPGQIVLFTLFLVAYIAICVAVVFVQRKRR